MATDQPWVLHRPTIPSDSQLGIFIKGVRRSGLVQVCEKHRPWAMADLRGSRVDGWRVLVAPAQPCAEPADGPKTWLPLVFQTQTQAAEIAWSEWETRVLEARRDALIEALAEARKLRQLPGLYGAESRSAFDTLVHALQRDLTQARRTARKSRAATNRQAFNARKA